MVTTKKHAGFFPAIAIAIVAGLLSPSAFAASGGATFFSAAPETTPVHNAVELNKLFQKGIGPYNSSMDGKLYPYPLPRNGQFGAPLYNGCYDRRGKRLHDLDTDLSCATAIQQNPGLAIFRLFLGYKISCSGGVTGTPTICSSAQLLMNCEYKQVQVGTGTLESTPAATRYCSNESGILRNAQGSAANDSVEFGCSPGEDGSTYNSNTPCPKCSPGTFNANFNPNKSSCTDCATVAPTPLPTGVASVGGWTSAIGATSSDSCRPTGVTCLSGYHPVTGGYCEQDGNCPIELELTPKNPSATVSPNPASSDGQITANATGANSAPSILITKPMSKAPSNTGLPAIFDGLSANTYTVTASDNTCSVSAKITLTESASTPSCGACPAGSTMSGTNCVMSPTTSSSYIQYQYQCQGAGGCTSQPCYPTCTQGMTFGQVSSSDSTPRTCDGGSLWVSFGGSCSKQTGPTTVPGSQSCPTGFSLVAGSCTMACTPPTCNLAFGSTSHTDATAGNNGSISISTSGAIGTLSATISPNVGTVNVTTGFVTVTNLPQGTYTVTVSDSGAAGCQKTQSFTIGGPSTCPYTPAMSMVANGTVTGNITANLFNNVGTLTAIHWTMPASGTCTVSGSTGNTMNCSGVSAGIYSITATDPANTSCTATASVTVGTPATCSLAFSLTGTNPSSSSSTDGALSGTTSGSAGSVSYSMSPTGGTITTQTNTAFAATGLGSGTYTVTATDAGVPSCSVSKSATLSAGPPTCPICPVGSIWDSGRQRCFWNHAITINQPYCEYSCTMGPPTQSGDCSQGYSYTDPFYGGTCTQTLSTTHKAYSCPGGGTSDYNFGQCFDMPTMKATADCPTGSTFDGTNCVTPTISCAPSRCSYSCTGAGSYTSTTLTLTDKVCVDGSADFWETFAGKCTTTSGAHSASNCCPLGFTYSGGQCIAPKTCDTTPRPSGGSSSDMIEISNTGVTGSPGSRTQVENINNLVVGNIYYCMVYSHAAWTVATQGDTLTTLAAKLAAAVNATTLAQWGDHDSDFTNFKPSATSSGNSVTLHLNYQNQFGCSSQYY